MNLDVQNATNAQLVAELVRRHGRADAPTSTKNIGQFSEVLIADGQDHTIRVWIEKDGPLLSCLPF